MMTSTKTNPEKFIIIDDKFAVVGKFADEKKAQEYADTLNSIAKTTKFTVIGKSWGMRENPMNTKITNPSEPTGAATERVVTYYRTPAHKKGREWLERELGQMRLFEYNPAHLAVERIGAKYGVLLNSQVLRRDLTKPQATQIMKELKTRAANIQKRNPEIAGAGVAADVAENLIDIFDVTGDGDIDRRDAEILRSFEPDEPQLVVDAENELTGEIVTETVDGDVVIEWADGATTIENKSDLAIENGFKSWRLRRKAARQYKRGLKYEEAARKARTRQSKIETELKSNPNFTDHKQVVINLLEIISMSKLARQVEFGLIEPINALHIARKRTTDAELRERIQSFINQLNYRQNPDLLSTFANLAVGTAAALEVNKHLGKRKTKKRSLVKKPNPSISQLVQTARKAGKTKVGILVANMAKVKEYAKLHGGAIRRHGIRYYYHLPKQAKNPAVTTPRKNAAPITKNVRVKKNNRVVKPRLKPNLDSYSAFQGRPSTKTMELVKPPSAPRRMWTLGKLFEIKILGKSEPLNFRREISGKTFWLCADEQNKQLWIAGGRSAEKDSSSEINDILGEIVHIVYETEKKHLGDNGLPSAYIHKMGEEGGARPTLEIDRDGFAYIVGGDYEITPLGIKN